MDALELAITALAVGIGAIGVMNTMVMSVFERTREIGILRAVGWRGSRIMRMIVGESLILCLVATVVGSALGVLASRSVLLIPAVRSVLDPQYTVDILCARWSSPSRWRWWARRTRRCARSAWSRWRRCAMSEGEPVLEMRGVVKKYEKGLIPALNGADLTVRRGEWIAIVGKSGCGKSTLLHLVGALDRPDAGTIRVNGRDLATERDLNHYRSREVGLVFQLHNLLMTLTASENVQVPLFELGLSARERRARADRILDLVGPCRQGDAPADRAFRG